MEKRYQGYGGYSFHLVICVFLTILLIFTGILYSVQEEVSNITKIIIYLLSIICPISLLQTCITDPGYIYRNRYEYRGDAFFLGKNVLVHTITQFSKIHCREVVFNGRVYTEEYCNECNVFKGGGVSHCRFCECCVIEGDHHCPWIDNCIGRNNLRFFLINIYSTTALLFYSVLYSYSLASDNHLHEPFLLVPFLAMLIFFATSLTFFCLLLSLSLYYVFLILFNLRSREFFKGTRKSLELDLSGCLRLLCGGINTIEYKGDYSNIV
jgi:palmitoyltransferase ZDHHC9/14/18